MDAATNEMSIDSDLENPLTGYHFWTSPPKDMDGDDLIKRGEVIFPYSVKVDGINLPASDFVSGTWPGYGTRFDAFLEGEKIGISTNPSSIPIFTYKTKSSSIDNPNPLPSIDDNRIIRLNGISIEVIDQESDGEVKVKIRWNDFDIAQKTRWCGNITLHDSMYIKNTAVVTLDQGLSPTRPVNPVLFKGNKIFADTTLLTLLSGSGATLSNTSCLNTINNSKLVVNASASLFMQDSAVINMQSKSGFVAEAFSNITLTESSYIIVDDTSTFRIAADANVLLKNNVYIKIKNGGKVIIEPGNNLELQDYAKIIIEDGGILYYEGNDLFLNSPNATIALQDGGTIQTADYIDFTFTGAGYLSYFENGIFDLGTDSRFYLKGSSNNDLKCWLQNDADLYISTRDMWLEDCKLTFNNGSLMRNAYANYYADNVMFNTGGSSAVNGISAYDTETFYITQATFDGFATPIKLENIDVCPDDVNVEIRQTTIKNYTQYGIQAEDVYRMYLYANSIEGNANATTGMWLENVVECNVEAGTIKNHTNQPGVMLYNTRYFILDGATVKGNYRGIESYRSNIYLRNQATIKQNTTEGIYALSAIDDTEDPDILCKIVVGDVGCGWIIQNATGILGEDILLDIDAITHAINEGDEEQPNRFDGNTTQAIDVCYDYFDNTYISNTLLAKGNYWSGGAAPSGSDVTSGFNANCNDITTDASQYVTTKPNNCDCTANCTDTEDEEALTLRMTNNSCGYYINEQGGGRISIAEKYQEAYQLFLANDFNYAYQKFNWIKNRVEAEYPQGLPDGICKDLYARAYWYKDQMAEIAEVHCQYPFYERTVEDNTIIPKFSVFPNPAQNTVTITCTEIGEAEYTIFSSSGIRIHNGRFEGSTQLQLENYASGIYFIQLQTETVAEILKLMVE